MALAGGVGQPPTLATLTAGAQWESVEAGESGGAVWRLSWPDRATAYLKHGTGSVADAIADEAARLRWLAGRAPVPAVRLFTSTPDASSLLTDDVPGLTGDEWLARSPDAWPQIVHGCAVLMRQLHALPVDDCPFDAGYRVRLANARRLVAAGLVDAEDFDPEHRGWSAAGVLAKAEGLAPCAAERVVTHGDFSLGNVLFGADGGVTGCIDVGRAGVADPYQDIAILWQNLVEFGVGAERMLLDELGMAAPDQRRLAFHRCLDELF